MTFIYIKSKLGTYTIAIKSIGLSDADASHTAYTIHVVNPLQRVLETVLKN